MSDLFLFTLNRSISASWVILAVVLARFLLRKAPKSCTCLLWWIVAARLFSAGFPQASFSLIPSTQTITLQSMYDRTPVITSGVELIDNVVNPVYTESFRASEVASVNPLQVWTAVAANVWLLVMIAIWLWAIVSWLRVRRRVAASVCLRDNIYICDAIDTPFILGILKPRIYLPSALGEGRQHHVIAHEQAHIHRRDHWYKPFAYFLLSINWFNPLIWLAYILLCRDIELACDERVIADMTAGDRKGYSAALLDCSIHRPIIAACPLAFGEVGVKERVKAVLSYRKPAFWLVLIALVIIAALAVCFITDPISAAPEIRYNGYLYVQDGDAVDHLPNKIQSFGELRSTLHDSTPHPTEDSQSVGLGWEYAGQPMYLVGNALYLEEPGGGSWLIFVRATVDDKPEENLLGIHLSVESPTPSGLTLVVNQDGTPWNALYTGSNYNVARWYEDREEWALLPQREGTAWTMAAYSVPMNETTRTGINWEWAYGKLEPGRYRIYKSYSGERGFLADREEVYQTCYAEFTIE